MDTRRVAVACGTLGPILLITYFATPSALGLALPDPGATPADIAAFALAHAALIYAAGWLQVTGSLLCVCFFAAAIVRAGAATRLAGVVALIGASTLVAVALVESLLFSAVPTAAAAGDLATVATGYALSTGGFLRVFPLAPASVTYVALGIALRGSGVLPAWAPPTAVALGVAFELAGFASIFTPAALIAVGVLSGVQSLWIVASAIALGGQSMPILASARRAGA